MKFVQEADKTLDSNEVLVNLFDYDHSGLVQLFKSWGEPSFRATQIIKWLHQQLVSDFNEMTNLKKSLRLHLQKKAVLKVPQIIKREDSSDGTIKWLISLDDGNAIETVFIPEGDRGTLCVSSQVGCALNCQFCATATQGFSRNLMLSEVIGQLWLARRELKQHSIGVTNVVFMGMGEPILNLDVVSKAAELMMSDDAYGLSKYRVTVSTSGVVPGMKELSIRVPDVSLAVSLHAAFDDTRTKLVPINKKYSLDVLLQACRDFYGPDSKRKITFEYVMLDGVNDSLADAKRLAVILEGIGAKINLIPFNPYPGARYLCSSDDAIKAFSRYMMKAGYVVMVRKTRGQDIQAACGQLVGDFKDRTKRRDRYKEEAESEVCT